MTVATLLLVAAVAVAFVMTIVWVLSVRLTNAGIVDVAWSANFALVAALYALLAPGDVVRRILAAGLMIVWSLRLATYLGTRVIGHIEVEDGRYAALRANWGPSANAKMFWFFQFQGVTNVLLSVPVLLAAMDPSPDLSLFEVGGVALWVVAVGGESVADAQLRRFKSNPVNKGRVCSEGLWRYSRHPNYFFEWLVWVAFLLFALGSPLGWISIYCPLLMLFFLYRVTGIPATEEQALRTKGEAYRIYQQTTSPFIPWFPKKNGVHA